MDIYGSRIISVFFDNARRIMKDARYISDGLVFNDETVVSVEFLIDDRRAGIDAVFDPPASDGYRPGIIQEIHSAYLYIIHLSLRDRIGHEVREPAHLGVVGRERGIVGGSLFGRERRVRVVVHGHGPREEIHECGVCRRKVGYRHAVCRGVVLIGGICLLNLREAVSQGCLLLARDHAVGGHLPQPHLTVVH